MILIIFMLSNQIAQCSCISHLNNKRKENICLCFYLIVCHFHPRFYCRNQCQQQNLSKVLKHKRCKFAEQQDAQKVIIQFLKTLYSFHNSQPFSRLFYLQILETDHTTCEFHLFLFSTYCKRCAKYYQFMLLNALVVMIFHRYYVMQTEIIFLFL